MLGRAERKSGGSTQSAEDEFQPRWELFSHEADMGVRGYGPTLHGAFEQAACGMTAVVADPGTIAAQRWITIRCDAPDNGLLLFEWLNAIVYEMATKKMLFSRFLVGIEGTRLVARIAGEPVDVARHQPAVEVKGATLTELLVTQSSDGIWTAQCVVDV